MARSSCPFTPSGCTRRFKNRAGVACHVRARHRQAKLADNLPTAGTRASDNSSETRPAKRARRDDIPTEMLQDIKVEEEEPTTYDDSDTSSQSDEGGAELLSQERPVKYPESQRMNIIFNLPSPHPLLDDYQDLWRRQFRASLISWSATLTQPFSPGDLSDEVKTLWGIVFADRVPLDEDGDHERWEIIDKMAREVLGRWRGNIGLAAIRVVVQKLRDDLRQELGNGDGDEAGIDAAQFLLEDLRFLRENPGGEENKRGHLGLFQSDLVIQTFKHHLRQSMYSTPAYKAGWRRNLAIGGLGLCVAAVQRALFLIRDGHISISTWPPVLRTPAQASTGRRRGNTNFSRSTWGAKTHVYAQLAEEMLTETQWKIIIQKSLPWDYYFKTGFDFDEWRELWDTHPVVLARANLPV